MNEDESDNATQPVYVLGAGFSAAISSHMPLTNGVGDEIKDRLANDIDVSDISALGFEDWLSVRVSPMPYLEGHENQRRLADAQRAISVIADVIEQRTTLAALQPAPLWLQQLVALWHAERAIVINFNYDNLVERAVNGVRLTSVLGGRAEVISADDVVYPSPTPPPAVTWADFESSRHDSFQLLKVHGSINWFWDAGDPAGSSLTRTRERSRFEGGETAEAEYTGIGLLDRFLIPPVATKSEYYTPPLTKILWRTAGGAVRLTSRLTLVGYSMPATDRATTEMLRGIPTGTQIHVINRDGDRNDDGRGSVIGRTAELFADEPQLWSGEECVEQYVRDRMEIATGRLQDSLTRGTVHSNQTSVIVVLPAGSPSTDQASAFALALKADEIRPVEITDNGVKLVSGGSAIEAALNSQAPGSYKQSDFVDIGRLREMIAANPAIIVTHGGRRYVAIGAEEFQLNRSAVLRLHLSPAG